MVKAFVLAACIAVGIANMPTHSTAQERVPPRDIQAAEVATKLLVSSARRYLEEKGFAQVEAFPLRAPPSYAEGVAFILIEIASSGARRVNSDNFAEALLRLPPGLHIRSFFKATITTEEDLTEAEAWAFFRNEVVRRQPVMVYLRGEAQQDSEQTVVCRVRLEDYHEVVGKPASDWKTCATIAQVRRHW